MPEVTYINPNSDLYYRNSVLRIKVRAETRRPAGHPGLAWLVFWKAGFPQSGPAVTEGARVSPVARKVGQTGRFGILSLSCIC